MVLAHQHVAVVDLPPGAELPASILLAVPADGGDSIDRLRREAPYLVASGRTAELLARVTSFPDHLAEREPWLLHYRAVALRLTSNDYSTAHRLQERAQALFAARADRAGTIRALAELGLLAHLCHRPGEARRFFAQARTDLSALDAPGQAAALCAMVDLSQSTDRPVPAPEEETITNSDRALLGQDQAIRGRLLAALHDGRLTERGLLLLRQRYRLTPAETSVFIEYYLCRHHPTERDDPKRHALARRLLLSENTLMHHVTSIRRKLGFGGRKGSAEVVLWCLEIGITNFQTQVHDDAGKLSVVAQPSPALSCHPGWVALAK